MDFLLCCPRGPDHQGRHAVPEAESAADGPPWTAGAEKDKEEEKIGHAAARAAKQNSQRIEQCDLRQKVREWMVTSGSRSRNGGKARGINRVITWERRARRVSQGRGNEIRRGEERSYARTLQRDQNDNGIKSSHASQLLFPNI
jgi:hypothetical protein